MTECLLHEGERLDDLQRNGLRLIQNPKAFCFGMDAVLLADFVWLRSRDRVADFGTGTGILPILLSQNRVDATFEAIEIQPDMAKMAERSVYLNSLEERIHIHALDMRDAWRVFGRESMDVIVCNPPYGKQGSTLHSTEKSQDTARHESDCSIGEICQAAASVLKNRGRAFFVFPAARLLELTDAMRKAHLEPKRMRPVCAKLSKPPYLMLVETLKNGAPSLLWMPPLVVYDEKGHEMPEMDRIYHRNSVTEAENHGAE